MALSRSRQPRPIPGPAGLRLAIPGRQSGVAIFLFFSFFETVYFMEAPHPPMSARSDVAVAPFKRVEGVALVYSFDVMDALDYLFIARDRP